MLPDWKEGQAGKIRGGVRNAGEVRRGLAGTTAFLFYFQGEVERKASRDLICILKNLH